MLMNKGGAKLLAIVLAGGLLWLVVLPRIASHPSVQHRVERYREAGIDNQAFFYTDHPAMRDIERKIDTVVNGADRAFWKWPE